MSRFNDYRLLGVHRESTDAEIKAAYRDKCGALHPDRQGGSADEFVPVAQAYARIKTAPLRSAHLAWMEFNGVACLNCDALGVRKKGRGFKTVAVGPCCECGGSGYREKGHA